MSSAEELLGGQNQGIAISGLQITWADVAVLAQNNALVAEQLENIALRRLLGVASKRLRDLDGKHDEIKEHIVEEA